MRRAFVSLYLVLVLSILAIGWGLDRLWEAYQQEPADIRAEQALLQVIQQTAHTSDPTALIRQLNEQTDAHLQLLPLSELSGQTLLDRLQQGETLRLADHRGRYFLYQQLQGQPYAIALETFAEEPRGRGLETLLAALFFVAIAAVVLIWVWPLGRDLGKLERGVQTLGSDYRHQRVSLPNRSTAFPLAQAFNRMADRILQLLQIQKEMTHAVSHELRTPLARMKFALEMIGDSEDLECIRQRLAGMRDDVAEIDQLVNQLLHYARFEQDRPPLEMKAGDIESLAEQIIQRLQEEHSSKSATIVCRENVFVCDWPLMERALLNLIQNALRYGRHQVLVALDKRDGDFVIEVEDDGPGVPDAERQRIFESFVRLRQTESQAAGFGLGLAIVARIAQWHNGHIAVTDSHLGGARFTLRWPADINSPA